MDVVDGRSFWRVLKDDARVWLRRHKCHDSLKAGYWSSANGAEEICGRALDEFAVFKDGLAAEQRAGDFAVEGGGGCRGDVCGGRGVGFWRGLSS